MNHAFLIIAYDSPQLLQRIIDRLETPNHFVFVHYDKKYQCPLLRVRYGECLPDGERIRVTHGGFSLIQAELILLWHAMNFHERIDYFHLISGHDYPCVSNDEFDQFFEKVPQGRSFMHFDTDEQHVMWKNKIETRINKWHLREIRCWRGFSYVIEKSLNLLLPRKKYDGELYAGWQWFSWHRSLVKWILSFCEYHPEFVNRFHYTNCSDEVLFHTLLYPHIEGLNIDRNNSLRYIDWTPQRKAATLPLVLDERDYQAILDSGALFCRKCYGDQSSKLISLLDKQKF